MSEEKTIATAQAPSKQKIAKATIAALLVAGVILITAVLPAEYGIDPLGTGAALGLMDLARSSETQTGIPASTPSLDADPAAGSEAPVINGVFTAQPSRYKIDSRELKLGPGEGLEIKYHMQKGAGMLYSWIANNAVFYEFHGEPDVKPAGSSEVYCESYGKNDAVGKAQSHATFTAPSTGIHGWFWENQSDGPVTIKLVSAGFYDSIMQNKDDVKTRLEPSDPK